jgi:hypothetical protein
MMAAGAEAEGSVGIVPRTASLDLMRRWATIGVETR